MSSTFEGNGMVAETVRDYVLFLTGELGILVYIERCACEFVTSGVSCVT